MNKLNKGKAKYILVLALLSLLYFITVNCSASGFHSNYFHSFLTVDTIPLNKTDSQKLKLNIVSDTGLVKKKADTTIIAKTDTFGFPTSKQALDAPLFIMQMIRW